MSSSPNKVPVSYQLTGVEELLETLKGLTREVATTVIAAGVTEAAKPLVKEIKRFAPSQTGALKRSITAKVIKQKKVGSAVAVVGPAWGKYSGSSGKKLKKGESSLSGTVQPARYAHLVEFGHLTKKGRVNAKPFMRPAIQTAGPLMAQNMIAGVSKGLLKAAKRYSKTAK